MVSTIPCPRCGKKNSKKAEICYNCKKPFKTRKKPEIFNFNLKSKIDLKIIAIGAIIFAISNIVFLNIVYDYSIYISGFLTMMYLYLVFKNSPKPEDSQNELKSMGLKIVLNYLLMAIIGIIILVALGFYR